MAENQTRVEEDRKKYKSRQQRFYIKVFNLCPQKNRKVLKFFEQQFQDQITLPRAWWMYVTHL